MNIGLMLSGGTGSRIGGDIPKQYQKINGKRIISFSLDSLVNSEYIDGICIVASKEWQEKLNEELTEKAKSKVICYAYPGDNRQMSIYNAMTAVREVIKVSKEDTVFIHDAARPYLTEEMIKKYVDAVNGHDGLLPVLSMKDTVYISEDGKKVTSLINRKNVYAGQAPEVFRFEKYYEANKVLLPDKIRNINGSTEPAIMAGMDVVMVQGEEKNTKITTVEDMENLKNYCKQRKS